ncbi:hypothetical protein ACRB68_00980 [Actinomadura sp. RB68]|uniref:Helix-turn-helix domain-containing protein n=2 Tax=Actinomadura macrotermitis TaxID=2585200 RepID=A0A7K0BLP1_9ACTN|nr:hypothetical protein [Actinomadura macrotermitis]
MAKWRPLDGEHLEPRILAEFLRTVADQHRQSLRNLAERIPYGRSTISDNLSGRRCPDWKFIEAFMRGCVPGDQHAQRTLSDRARPLWEAASRAPDQLTPVDRHQDDGERRESQGLEGVPDPMRQIVATLSEIAAKQDHLARVQMSVAGNHALTAGLLGLRDGLDLAVQTLLAEREALRAERDRLNAGNAHYSDLHDQLRAVKEQLAQTQARLEAAHRLQAETEQRLREAERQRIIAERLRLRTARQLQQAVATLTGLDTPDLDGDGDPAPGAVVPSDDLLGPADQQIARDRLAHADTALAALEHGLGQLSAETQPAPDTAQTTASAVRTNTPTRPDSHRTPGLSLRSMRRVGRLVSIGGAIFAIITGVIGGIYINLAARKSGGSPSSSPSVDSTVSLAANMRLVELTISADVQEISTGSDTATSAAIHAIESGLAKKGIQSLPIGAALIFAGGRDLSEGTLAAEHLAKVLPARIDTFRNAIIQPFASFGMESGGVRLRLFVPK